MAALLRYGARAPLCAAARRPLSSFAQPMRSPLREVQISRDWTPRSKRCGALGMKCGMTQAWNRWGQLIPLTVIEIQDCQVIQVKTPEREGFAALQLGAGWQKRKRLNKSAVRHFESRALPLKRYLREFKVTEDALLPVGTSITAAHFVPGQSVDVQGVTKGHGFQGVMKRWGFAGGNATHGNTKAHRTPGSMGGAAGDARRTMARGG